MRLFTERWKVSVYKDAAVMLAEGCLGPLLGVNAALYMGKNCRLIDALWHDGTHTDGRAHVPDSLPAQARKALGREIFILLRNRLA
jgi:hypothetical protein